jgi:hypothetical protein
VEDSQHLDTIREHDEVDDVPKLLQPRGSHIFPHCAMQLRHLFDAGKHFPNTGKNLISEANTNGLKLVAGPPEYLPLPRAAGLPADSRTSLKPL